MRWMSDFFRGEPWFHFNGYQSGHRDDEQHLKWLTTGLPATSWKRTPVVADVNLEPNYEGHNSRSPNSTVVFGDYHMRRAVWWSLLVAPPAGVTYGAHGIWSWETTAREPLNHRGTGVARPWREALAFPGSGQMAHVKKLFTRFEWWRLHPAPSLLVEQPGDRDATAFVPIATALDENVHDRLPAERRIGETPHDATRLRPMVRSANRRLPPPNALRYRSRIPRPGFPRLGAGAHQRLAAFREVVAFSDAPRARRYAKKPGRRAFFGS
jgi:hypothetical protein